MAIPTFHMKPSGIGLSKLYSQVPLDGTGDFTFDRNVTATRVDTDGLLSSVEKKNPRLDYSDAVCPSLLLEPQSTNLQVYSEDVAGGAGWALSNLSTVAQASPSADSPLGAYDLIENTNTSTHRLRGGIFTTVAAESTMSVYVKYSTKRYVELRDFPSASRCRFDLLNNVVILETNAVAKIEDAGNGFKRISITYTSVTTSRIQFSLLSDSLSNNYTGDGTSKVTIFGFQIEYSGYASSYIPTTSAALTRLGDTATGAGDASTFNSEEGVLFVELAALANDGTGRYMSINDGTNNNTLSLEYTSTDNTVNCQYKVGGVTQADLSFVLVALDYNKVAFKYKENDFALWVNGVEVGTDNSGVVNIASTFNQFGFTRDGLSLPFYGKIKDLQAYDVALTDTELGALTTI